MDFLASAPPYFCILSGAPGAGKTSLLSELTKRGFAGEHELARRLIQQAVHAGSTATPWQDSAQFAQNLWHAEGQRWLHLLKTAPAHAGSRPLLLDRSWVDAWVCCAMEGVEPDVDMLKDLRQGTQTCMVLLCAPWAEIYVQDAERKQSWKAAQHSFQLCRDAYGAFGFQVIEVPQLPLGERADWVEALLAPGTKD